MTAVSSTEWGASYEVETAFGEATNTWGTRLQLAEKPDISGIVQEYINRGGTYQRMGEGEPYIPGVQLPEFDISMWGYGHGSATNGALSAKPLSTLLGLWLGNTSAAQVGGSLTSGGTTSQITSSNTTLLANGLCRVGVGGDSNDGRGGGQATVPAGATSPYTLNVNLPAAPNSGDGVFAMLLAYPAVNTKTIAQAKITRWLLQSGNYQFAVRGCFATGIKLTGTNEGEVPKWTFHVAGASFLPRAETFPSTTAVNDKAPAVVSGGWLHIGSNTASTRNVMTAPRDVEIEIVNDITILKGNAGGGTYQVRQGFVRANSMFKFRCKVMAEAATATPTWYDLARTNPNSVTPRRILWQSNTIDGSVLAFHAQRAVLSNIPTMIEGPDGLNYIQLEFDCLTGTDTSSELTLAPGVFGMG